MLVVGAYQLQVREMSVTADFAFNQTSNFFYENENRMRSITYSRDTFEIVTACYI